MVGATLTIRSATEADWPAGRALVRGAAAVV
jgi:hypothetical protein